MTDYLDAMDECWWQGPKVDPPVPRMIAALGPRMLDLARRRTRGAIPYLVPVSYTGQARATLGADPVLAIHQAVVLGESTASARVLAAEHVGRYLRTQNYPNNFRRLGFSEADLAGDGSEHLLNSLVAWGGPDEVAERIRAHLDAGADHVCVNTLTDDFPAVPVKGLQALSEALGGRPRM